MSTVSANLNTIHDRIEAAALACDRDPASVKLVAVSKTKPVEQVQKALDAGQRVFGENYIQEARDKVSALSDSGAIWHFIGHLQRNKAKYAVHLFDLIHGVDSVRLAHEIDKQAAKIGKIQPILVQINIGGEETKSGITTEDALALVKEIAPLANLSVKGLMTIPPWYNEPERVRPCFAALRETAKVIANRDIDGVVMEELSMGMTGDFETAIAEGATLVRIGTAIFGGRT